MYLIHLSEFFLSCYRIFLVLSLRTRIQHPSTGLSFRTVTSIRYKSPRRTPIRRQCHRRAPLHVPAASTFSSPSVVAARRWRGRRRRHGRRSTWWRSPSSPSSASSSSPTTSGLRPPRRPRQSGPPGLTSTPAPPVRRRPSRKR